MRLRRMPVPAVLPWRMGCCRGSVLGRCAAAGIALPGAVGVAEGQC